MSSRPSQTDERSSPVSDGATATRRFSHPPPGMRVASAREIDDDSVCGDLRCAPQEGQGARRERERAVDVGLGERDRLLPLRLCQGSELANQLSRPDRVLRRAGKSVFDRRTRFHHQDDDHDRHDDDDSEQKKKYVSDHSHSC